MNHPIIPIGSVLLSLMLPFPTTIREGQASNFTPGCCSWVELAFRPAYEGPVFSRALAPGVPPQSPSAPSSNSPTLRAALLARATAHLSPKWKNPGISERGLDPAIVTVLQQQKSYLHSATRPTNFARFPAPPFSTGPATSCRNALIRTVNGKALGVIFTPSAFNNAFRIEGCLFGNIRGHLELEPHPADPALRIPAIPLVVDSSLSSWSDNQIEAHLDSRVSGIPDVPVTLVLHLAGGQRLELPGCLFVASRGMTTLLQSIPASWINLQPTTIHSHSIERLEYISPPVRGPDVPVDATGASAFVSRLDAEDFGTGTDVYDFAQLNPGWVVDSVQLQTYDVACPGDSLSRQSTGHWDTQWNGRRLTIQLQDDVCVSQVSPSFTFHLSVSQYALKVWVVGPVGTKPLADALLHNTNRSFTQTN